MVSYVQLSRLVAVQALIACIACIAVDHDCMVLPSGHKADVITIRGPADLTAVRHAH